MEPAQPRRKAANAPDRATGIADGNTRETPVAQDATADEIVAEEEEFDDDPSTPQPKEGGAKVDDEVVADPSGDKGGSS